MSMTKIALAFPLALGLACSTSGAQSRDHAPAIAAQSDPGTTDAALSVQPTAGTEQGSGSGSMGTGSSDSSGSSGSMGSQEGSSGSASGSDGMGSGGSSDTMGSEHEGSSGQGSAGSSDQAQGATAGAGNTGAHMGDQHVMGKITKISKDEISIAPKGAKAKTLKINEDTSVQVNGKDAKWTQLKKGQSVRASYENVSGDDVAVRIESGAMRHGRMKHHMGGGSSMHGGSESGGSSGSAGSPETGK